MIWVIAGTRSGREIAWELLGMNYRVIATTATIYGSRLMGSHENLTVSMGRKGKDELSMLARDHCVRLIIDASHPYSIEVSENAMAIALEQAIPYLRYERENVDSYECTRFRSYIEAAAYLEKKSGNILLTIGTNNMSFFSGFDKKRLYARIAPFMGSIEACEQQGFQPGQIIAMSFSFSRDFNSALYRELEIKYLVTKESGDDGGIREKLDAAVDSGVEIVLIERPVIQYPEVIYDRSALLKRTGEILNG